MSGKWLIFILFVYIVGMFLGATFEQHATAATWEGSSEGVTTLSYLMNVGNAVQQTSVLGVIPLPIPNGEYFSTLFEVLTWQFAFMADYDMVYWILMLPFAIAGIFSLIMLFIGTITGNISWS